jgi:hypothetical protein
LYYAFCLGVSYTAAFQAAIPILVHLTDLIEMDAQSIANKKSLITDLDAEVCKTKAQRFENEEFIRDLEAQIEILEGNLALNSAALGATGVGVLGGVAGLTQACKGVLLNPLIP